MRKIMAEATQPVVDGNTVVVAPGDLFEQGSVPEWVRVREVVVDAPDVPEPVKPAGKTPGK